MITELTLENFRGFRSLELKDFKHVNLIVGHNNSGKTSLLEGIFILCEPQRVGELPGSFRAQQGDPKRRYFPWLLRDGPDTQRGSLKARSSKGNHLISLGLGSGSPERPHQFRRPEPGGFEGSKIYGSKAFQIWDGLRTGPLSCRIIPIQHRDANSLVPLVGKAQRKKAGEETLERLLAIVDPRIKKVRVDPGEDGNQVIIDIGLSELVPVSQAGQGVYRLVTILADIIGETPEVLLIDEVENGLHHSVHEQVWKGLAEMAATLNVQIFATTHSDECYQAAHRAFKSRKEYDFRVIQLFRVEASVQGRVLDQKHIEAALAGEIELR